MNDSPTLDEIKSLIAKMSASDRAMLRPWILARFDVQGNPMPRPVRTPPIGGIFLEAEPEVEGTPITPAKPIRGGRF